MNKLGFIIAVFLTILAAASPCLYAGSDPLGPDSVVFQAFYWDVPPGGTWYDKIRVEAPTLKSAGFTHFWFPPPTKGAAGGSEAALS